MSALPLEVHSVRIIAGKLPEEIEREMDECLNRWKQRKKKKDVKPHYVLSDETVSIQCIVPGSKVRETLYKIWAMSSESNLCGYCYKWC